MKKTLKLMLLTVAALLLYSCEKYNDDTDFAAKDANCTLIIRTRAGAAGDEDGSKISYPVNVYVFSGNACVETARIESEVTPMSLRLPEGSYEVYAIAGADAETYDLPSKENASREYLVRLNGGKTHADLMTAKNSVTLAYGEENTLTLSLERKVMLVENVSIRNVPSSVIAVSVTLSPLYENILLDGSYGGTDGSQTLELTRGSDGKTWENISNVYLLEASGPATVKVSLQTESKTRSYSYTSTDELKANYRINITGTYNEDGIQLNGTITGATWEGVKNISFSFDETGSSADEGTGPETGGGNAGEDTGGTASGNAPEAGTLYKDFYVLKSESSGAGTVVTLMSTSYEKGLSFTDNDQSSIKESVEQKLEGLAAGSDGLGTLRLPTLEELKYVKSNLEAVNDNLERLGKSLFVTGSGTLYSYYFLDGDGLIKAYWPSRDEPDSEFSCISTDIKGGRNSIILRGFTTVTFME